MLGLSVLIPIHNTNVSRLVASLSQQLTQASIAWQIVLIDDASQATFQTENALAGTCEFCIYKQLSRNVGRSQIRNLLIQQAQYEWLLFLDDKNSIPNDFIQLYLLALQQHAAAKIIVGGKKPAKPQTSRQQKLLRYRYAVSVEHKPAHRREKKPYQSFITGNFLAHRSVFEKIEFENRIQTYGHEDTLLGLMLKETGIPIKHIDNSVSVSQWDDNCVFLKKNKHAVRNLLFIYEQYKYLDLNDIRLLRVYEKTGWIRTLFGRAFWKRLAFWLETQTCKTGSVLFFNSFKFAYLTYLMS